jgi:hypothetical protein
VLGQPFNRDRTQVNASTLEELSKGECGFRIVMTPPDSTALRARIFLSSGQTEGTAEVALVFEVQRCLERMGYEVTDATGTTVPRAVWWEVLRRLRETEYFILVAFRRKRQGKDPLTDGWDRSLLSHQELAIALSRETPFLVFSVEGLPSRVGALRMVPSTLVPFVRSNLVERVGKSVADSAWRSDWRNELRLARPLRGTDNTEWVRFGPGPTYLSAKYFHIGVTSVNRTVLATDVHAFLESWSGGPSVAPTTLSPLLELKWDAVTPRAVSIPTGTTRRFSALLMFREQPDVAQLGVNFLLMDSNALRDECRFTPPGIYRLNFVVYSREFAPARQTFELKFGHGHEDSELVATRQRKARFDPRYAR